MISQIFARRGPSGPRRLAAALGLLIGSVCSAAAQAPPSLMWESSIGSDAENEESWSSARLSPTRFVAVGRTKFKSIVFNTRIRALTVFTNQQGDSLEEQQRQRYYRNPNEDADYTAVAATDHGDFYAYGLSQTTPGNALTYLTRLDSTGQVRWEVPTETVPGFGVTHGDYLTAFPGNVWITSSRSELTPRYSQCRVMRYDLHGQLVWERRYGYYANGIAAVPRPDGTYWVVSNDYARQPGSLQTTYFGKDIRLEKMSVGGDSLGTAWLGAYPVYEEAITAKATTDGGLVLTARQAAPPSNHDAEGVLIKVDSSGAEQWRYVWPGRPSWAPGTDYRTTGPWLYDVQELANGHFLLTGRLYLPVLGTYLLEVAPPAGPGQPATEVWRSAPITGGSPQQLYLAGDSAGTVQAFGFSVTLPPVGFSDSNVYVAQFTGVSAPAVIDYCATPPSRPAATMGPLVGDSIAFEVATAGQSAGPSHAEISLVEWDFGDGTPRRDGWLITHHFASPAPVAVRVRVCNNLGCCRDTTFYPFGVPPLSTGVDHPGAVAVAHTVSIYPNPSASGQFTLRAPQVGATYTVADAVGRTVAAGALPGAETVLDLRAQPAGVYCLRLTWPDGRAISKRLVRW